MVWVQGTACDFCSQVKPTKPYEVAEGGRAAKVDICISCAKPIEAVLPVRRKLRGSKFVSSIEEIEASKGASV